VLNLKTLGSERVGYRIWAEKLKNIINHVRPRAKWLLEMVEGMVTKTMPESEEAIIRVMEASECPKGA
jgi:hypothetical protein